MRFRRCTPVHPCAIVMYRVIAIVEEQLVKEADEISRVIELRLFISMHMLDEIEDKHGEEPNLLRHNNKEQCLLPIDDKTNCNPDRKHDILRQTEPEVFTVLCPLRFQIIADRLLLVIAGNSWIREQHRKVIVLC